eukprot:9098998-Ditylum_brightwellii.AAC.1
MDSNTGDKNENTTNTPDDDDINPTIGVMDSTIPGVSQEITTPWKAEQPLLQSKLDNRDIMVSIRSLESHEEQLQTGTAGTNGDNTTIEDQIAAIEAEMDLAYGTRI